MDGTFPGQLEMSTDCTRTDGTTWGYAKAGEAGNAASKQERKEASRLMIDMPVKNASHADG